MYKPYCIGEEVPFIGSISNGIKIRYSKVIEVNEEEKTVEIKLNPPQPQYSAH